MAQSMPKAKRKKAISERPSRSGWAALGVSIGLILSGCSQASEDMLLELADKPLLSYETYQTSSLPLWFSEELFDESQATELYANEDETIFGLNVDKSPAASFNEICTSMESKGWVRIESGMEHCATFIREQGDPSWALVSCTNTGSGTSIVVCAKERPS
ncbi:MAG: hypothetical protein IKV48_07980 [Eggerthellaceae bacterium]|nr:hypothetical protein [Eggerthellaceae bacterium]